MPATSKVALHRLAAEVREELELGGNQPFDANSWADLYGVPFVPLDAIAASELATARFLVGAPELWSAALIQDGTGQVVVYNPAHAPARVRSNLAHEVAHFVAEHEMSPAWINEKGGCGGSGKGHEKEAAELAGALLIPVERAKLHAMRGDSPLSVADIYGVSIKMAQWRMRVSGGAIIAARARRRRA